MADRRLLFVCSQLTVGGYERHLAQLAPGLRGRGFDPLVVALREEGPIFHELRDLGIPMRFAGMRSRTDLRGLRRAVSFSDHPAVVISQSIDAHVAAAMIARRAAAPHVAVEHAAPALLRNRRLHHLVAYRWVAPRVAQAVALSRTQIPEMVALRYPEDAIRVIPNGIPVPHPARASTDVRTELGLRERDFVVTLVATLRPEKRGEWFVDAIVEASRTEPSIRGVVVGGGPHLERVRARAEPHPDVVKVLGERSDVPDLVAASDAVGLSSIAECLPLSVLEAMALARPVVGTDVGGMGEVVVHGETGLLVPPDDPGALSAAIIRLARNPELAMEMGLAARRRYEREYTIDRMIDAYAELFDDLPSGRRARLATG
jgi:glycosyltransferase involved in cell wall biosynthesis